MLEIPNETRLGGWGGNAADMSFKSGHACQPGFDNVTEHQIWKKRHHFFKFHMYHRQLWLDSN